VTLPTTDRMNGTKALATYDVQAGVKTYS
jgi:hypothetical protein